MLPKVIVNEVAELFSSASSAYAIIEYFCGFGEDFEIDIPHKERSILSKSVYFKENLSAFSTKQQLYIIEQLLNLNQFSSKPAFQNIKKKLNIYKIQTLTNTSISGIEETKYWLSEYSKSKQLFEKALNKYQRKYFTVSQSNYFNELIQSIELLLQNIFENENPINQQAENIKTYIKSHEGSQRIYDTFIILINYFNDFNSTKIKSRGIALDEFEFIYEISTSFIKLVIKIENQYKIIE